MNITTVYVVTRGSYSDYSIEAIYSTRALAEKHCALFPGYDDSQIEEYPLNEFAPHISAGKTHWLVRVSPDGTAHPEKHNHPREVLKPGFKDIHRNICFFVWAKDEMAARQIACQRWVEMQAAAQ
jgi:hypothetical protein